MRYVLAAITVLGLSSLVLAGPGKKACKSGKCASCVKPAEGSAQKAAMKGCPEKPGCKGAQCKAKMKKDNGHAATIDTKELKAKLGSEEELVVLDARGGKYDDGKRIPGAKQLTAAADKETIEATIGSDKSKKIITYCSNVKCGASAALAKKLRKVGYTNVTEYPPGIAGWIEAGNNVEDAKK